MKVISQQWAANVFKALAFIFLQSRCPAVELQLAQKKTAHKAISYDTQVNLLLPFDQAQRICGGCGVDKQTVLSVLCIDSPLLLLRLGTSAVYVFVMLFQNEAMLQKLEWTKGDGDLYQALGQLLSKDEPDVVLIAAGAMTSLVTITHPEKYHTNLVFRNDSLHAALVVHLKCCKGIAKVYITS